MSYLKYNLDDFIENTIFETKARPTEKIPVGLTPTDRVVILLRDGSIEDEYIVDNWCWGREDNTYPRSDFSEDVIKYRKLTPDEIAKIDFIKL